MHSNLVKYNHVATYLLSKYFRRHGFEMMVEQKGPSCGPTFWSGFEALGPLAQAAPTSANYTKKISTISMIFRYMYKYISVYIYWSPDVPNFSEIGQ